MRAPERDPEGHVYIRFLDLSASELDAHGYPGHPVGRYVSLDDLQRAADDEGEPEDALNRVIALVRESLSIQELQDWSI